MRVSEATAKARTRTHLQAFEKLTQVTAEASGGSPPTRR